MNPISEDCDKNPFSGECSNFFIIGYLIKDYRQEYKNMSSQENIMDAEETENWIEQQSAAAVEWNDREKGRN